MICSVWIVFVQEAAIPYLISLREMIVEMAGTGPRVDTAVVEGVMEVTGATEAMGAMEAMEAMEGVIRGVLGGEVTAATEDPIATEVGIDTTRALAADPAETIEATVPSATNTLANVPEVEVPVVEGHTLQVRQRPVEDGTLHLYPLVGHPLTKIVTEIAPQLEAGRMVDSRQIHTHVNALRQSPMIVTIQILRTIAMQRRATTPQTHIHHLTQQIVIVFLRAMTIMFSLMVSELLHEKIVVVLNMQMSMRMATRDHKCNTSHLTLLYNRTCNVSDSITSHTSSKLLRRFTSFRPEYSQPRVIIVSLMFLWLSLPCLLINEPLAQC